MKTTLTQRVQTFVRTLDAFTTWTHHEAAHSLLVADLVAFVLFSNQKNVIIEYNYKHLLRRFVRKQSDTSINEHEHADDRGQYQP